MLIGYARVSSEEQNLDLQLHALRAAHCDVVYQDDGISAVARQRPGFDQAMAALQPSSILVVWKLDRAFRSLRQAIDTLEIFEKKGISFRSLTEHIDTSTPMGQAMYQIQNVFSELERKLISERTKAGMAAARRNGKVLGRPRKLSQTEIAWACAVIKTQEFTLEQAAAQLRVSSNALNRLLSVPGCNTAPISRHALHPL